VASFGEYQLNPYPEKARDYDYDDYDADDVEDVHCHAPGELVVTLVWDGTTMLDAPEEFRLLLYERTDGASHFRRRACLARWFAPARGLLTPRAGFPPAACLEADLGRRGETAEVIHRAPGSGGTKASDI
jgi:hypothetical protein